MAERRMFAKSITGSARFLRMPVSSRLLYYDLGMAADDDGVVEAFSVLRLSGATEDDLRVLASKSFVQVLNDDLVSVILDWKQNNQIRPDRYKPSIYADLLKGLPSGIPSGNQAVNQAATGRDTSGKPRLGKERLGEDSSGTGKPSNAKKFVPPSLDEVQMYCQERGNNVDPQRFLDHYTASGWVRGKTPIKDWKACVRTWEKKEESSTPPQADSSFSDRRPRQLINGVEHERDENGIWVPVERSV